MNLLTDLREGLAISWSAIRANKLRSVLTTLGIVIGIVTVTLMGTAIEGLNGSFLKSVSSVGADMLYVDRISWFINTVQDSMKAPKNPKITLDEADTVERQMQTEDHAGNPAIAAMDEASALEREMKLASAIAPVAHSCSAARPASLCQKPLRLNHSRRQIGPPRRRCRAGLLLICSCILGNAGHHRHRR